jgi:hypothetical protein
MAMKRSNKQAAEAVDKEDKDFLTVGEMKRLLDVAKGSRYGQRDYLMLLMAYRHGLKLGRTNFRSTERGGKVIEAARL